MSLYKEPIPEILESIKSENGVDLVENQYTYGAATETVPGPSGENTTMSVTSKGAQSAYDGAVVVAYKRRNLAELNNLVKVNIKAYNVATTLDVANRLNTLYGLNLTADDIVSSPANLVDGVGTVTLVAKPESRGWIGEVDIIISVGDRPIEDFLTVTRLPGLSYPAPSVEKPYAAVYGYWRDFSSQSTPLSGVVLGESSLEVLRDALQAVTGDTWSSTAAGRYSLLGANVTYVGPTSNQALSNTDYDRVILVQLNEANCTGLSGTLIIHYNES